MARYNVDHKEHIISIRFTEDGWKEVDYLCESLGISKAKVVREAVKILAKNVRLDEEIRAEAMAWRKSVR